MATRKPRRAPRSGSKAPRKAKPAPRAARARRPAASRRPRKAATPALRSRRSPETLRLRSLMPNLTVNDLERSVRFYSEALGFFVSERWTDGPRLTGVMLKAGACELGLSQDDWAKGRDRTKGVGMSLWLLTAQDVDALAARIKAAGVTLTQEPKDQPWGGRSLALVDPDGFRLTLYRE